MNNTQNKVTVDGIEYDVEKLPSSVQQQLSLYQQWESELNQQRLALAKTECAMKFLSNDLIAGIKASTQEAVNKAEENKE